MHISTEIGLMGQTPNLMPFFETINDGQYVDEYRRMITSDIIKTRPVLTTSLQKTGSRLEYGTRIPTSTATYSNRRPLIDMVRCFQKITIKLMFFFIFLCSETYKTSGI
jgi:hypothetical protein